MSLNHSDNTADFRLLLMRLPSTTPTNTRLNSVASLPRHLPCMPAPLSDEGIQPHAIATHQTPTPDPNTRPQHQTPTPDSKGERTTRCNKPFMQEGNHPSDRVAGNSDQAIMLISLQMSLVRSSMPQPQTQHLTKRRSRCNTI
jgi:hypothetical protein